MNRLASIVVVTKNYEAMRAFYAEGIGMELRHADGARAAFDTHGAGFELRRAGDDEREGLHLRFETDNLVRDVGSLRARGVRFDGDIIEAGEGRLVHLWDPEDNLVTLLQPDEPARDGLGPAIGDVILNCEDYPATVVFYRELMGFEVLRQGDHEMEFDTGLTRLLAHARPTDMAHPRHADQPVAFTIETDDLNATASLIRERGLHFVTAPMSEDFGTYAELQDPDGLVVVLREHEVPESFDEQLAAAFEEDGPHRVAMRKPVVKGTQAISRLVNRPGYKSKKRAVKKAAAARAEQNGSGGRVTATTTRRTASAKSARKPARDLRRAKSKPAIGRLKKAKRRVAASQRAASAQRSRAKPVKRAASRRAAAKRTRTAARASR